MQATHTTYSVAGPNIVFQIIDSEAIILDLEKGYYYSLRYSGVPIWEALVSEGHTVADTVKILSRLYEAPEGTIETAVEKLVQTLLADKMIVADTGPHVPSGKKDANKIGAKKPFIAPAFEKYTDMQQLLVMDPIHEIDPSAGWPKRAQA